MLTRSELTDGGSTYTTENTNSQRALKVPALGKQVKTENCIDFFFNVFFRGCCFRASYIHTAVTPGFKVRAELKE